MLILEKLMGGERAEGSTPSIGFGVESSQVKGIYT